jgi:hypothetical protein
MRSTMGVMDLRLIARDGVFAAAKARAFGIDSSSLRRAVAAGQAFPLCRGWYSTRAPTTPRDHHLLRTTALLQEYGGHVVASHGSAVLRLGLPDVALDLGTVQLMWRGDKPDFRSYSRVHVHEEVADPRLTAWVTTVHPALAVVQVGLRDVRSMLVAGDAALRLRMVDAGQLAAAVDALRGQRGLTRARAAAGWFDARHQSPGETLTAFVLRGLGYSFTPQFEPGTQGKNGGPEQTDFVIDGTRVLVEFDGRSKYSAASEDDAQRLLFAEKRREDRIRDLGYEMVRVTWAEVHQPERVRAKVEKALSRWRSRAV